MRCKLRPELAVGSVGGQLRGDEECPFNGVTSFSRVSEEGVGKRCTECGQAGACAVRGGGTLDWLGMLNRATVDRWRVN